MEGTNEKFQSPIKSVKWEGRSRVNLDFRYLYRSLYNLHKGKFHTTARGQDHRPHPEKKKKTLKYLKKEACLIRNIHLKYQVDPELLPVTIPHSLTSACVPFPLAGLLDPIVKNHPAIQEQEA